MSKKSAQDNIGDAAMEAMKMAMQLKPEVIEVVQEEQETPGESVKDDNNPPKQLSMNESIIQWLKSMYEFRYNLVKRRVEYRVIAGRRNKWETVSNRKLETWSGALRNLGFNSAGAKRVLQTLTSEDVSGDVHPIKAFLEQASRGDNHDYIKDLANTIVVKRLEGGHKDTAGQKFFEKCLKKWLVAAVANVLDDENCQNHTCLVLISEGQGLGKSTWIKHLVPEELRKDYYMRGTLDPTVKDHAFRAASFWIYDMDDTLVNTTSKFNHLLKEFITRDMINDRRPHAVLPENLPKIASFIGSSNSRAVLFDSENRRFLPFEVEDIDLWAVKELDMKKVWWQAYNLYMHDKQFKHWFDAEDAKELKAHNQYFTASTLEEDMIMRYFRVPTASDSDSEKRFLSTGEVLEYISGNTKLKSFHSSPRKIGSALQRLGFLKKQRVTSAKNEKKRKSGYYVVMRKKDEIKSYENYVDNVAEEQAEKQLQIDLSEGKVKEYHFRAKLAGDVLRLQSLLSSTYPEAKVEHVEGERYRLITSVNLKNIRLIMSKVPDSVVLYQTVQLKEKYTGNRDISINFY